MKLGGAFQSPRPWKILINGEPLEDVEKIELTYTSNRPPEISFKLLVPDGRGGIASCYGLPAYILFKVPFSGSLKGEIEAASMAERGTAQSGGGSGPGGGASPVRSGNRADIAQAGVQAGNEDAWT